MEDSSIFLSNDIRGKYPVQINESFAERLGWVLADIMRYNGKVAIAGDARDSTPELKRGLSKGLTTMGVDVVDIGMGPTPMLYFTLADNEEFQYGVMITASHNPPIYNGFKICNEDGVSMDYENFFSQLQKIVDLPFNEFEKRKHEQRKEQDLEANYHGKAAEDFSYQDKYYEYLKFSLQNIPQLKVAVEYGNGATGRFSELFPDNSIHIHQKPRADFPHLNPDPTKPETFRFLEEIQKTQPFDFGIAFDGDGDRVGFFLPNYGILSPDQAMMLYVHDFVETAKRGARVVLDVKMSKATKEFIESKDGIVLLCKVGHSYIQDLILKEKADIGGELSCHYYFNDRYYGFDDGLYSAVRMLDLVGRLEKAGKKLEDVLDTLPKYFSSPEIRKPMPKSQQMKVIERLRKWGKMKGATLLEIDGVRCEFPDGWLLVRGSNTEEKISYRVEGISEEVKNRLLEDLERLVKSVVDEAD